MWWRDLFRKHHLKIFKSMLSILRRQYSSAVKTDLAHSYQKTLHLPKTKLPKRSSHEKNINDLIPRSSQLLYKEQFELKPTNKDVFILHDGPPYANGDLHLGHALNKVLKDMINRYHLSIGKKVYYKPGWDCHGLPIELKALEKANSKFKKDSTTVLPVKQIRKLAREHANKTIIKQLNKFKELAILTDFEHNYKTLNHDFEINQLKIFQKLLNKNLIRRQKKPVFWGCETHTALAESELEYNDKHRSTAAFIKFPLTTSFKEFKNVSLLIWTSTPWTIPANKAISINENFSYTLISNHNESLIVANDLVDSIMELNPEFRKTDLVFLGYELLDLKYKNPLFNDDQIFPILHGDHVTNSSGTGLVHTAPGHGNDDYFVCLKKNIDAYSPVDQFGCYTNEINSNLKQLVGLKVIEEGNPKIIQLLSQHNMLFNLNEHYIHSYPYDWRSKKPIIIRSTPQWFCNVGEIKQKSEDALEEVRFIPERGQNRLLSFIKNRNEWCISRQRSWGVPIPALYHKTDDNKFLLDDESVRHIISKIDELGTDSWFEEEENIERWLPESLKGEGLNYAKGKDTMDVWFDSGSSWTEIVNFLQKNNINDRGYLADVYLEGSDQHRGWFQSSLLTKIGTSDESHPNAPYKTIVTHGFTLDEAGFKMSKSIGNTLSPDAIIKGDGNILKHGVGVDGLRLWVAQSDYTSDMSIGPNILKHVGDALKKLRITLTFLLGNLNGFEKSEVVETENLRKIDQYALSKLTSLNEEVLNHYSNYNFNRALKALHNHLNIESSAIYFDIIKDRLYTDSKDGLSRRAAQTVLVEILKAYSVLFAPITPLITQEVWDFSPNWITENSKNPLIKGTSLLTNYRNEELELKFNKVWEIKDKAKLIIEEGRKSKDIKSSLESDIYISVPENSKIISLLKEFDGELEDIFMTSHFKINEQVPSETGYKYSDIVHVDAEALEITVVPSSQEKCPRCWKFTSENETDLCPRCEEVVGHE